jgi:hypothetical protein
MKILFSEFHHRTNLMAPFLVIWCPETKQNPQNFEIQVPKGTPLVKSFEILSRNSFHGLKIVFRRYNLVETSAVRFILG